MHADGVFAIAGVPPGHYRIDARVTGPLSAHWTLRDVAQSGRVIAGRLVEVAGNDLSGLELRLADDLASLTGFLLASDGSPVLRWFNRFGHEPGEHGEEAIGGLSPRG